MVDGAERSYLVDPVGEVSHTRAPGSELLRRDQGAAVVGGMAGIP